MRHWLWRLKAAIRRPALLEEKRGELAFHFDQEVRRGLQAGLSRAEAERIATLRAGRVDAALEASRDELGFPWLDNIGTDLRQASRALRRAPGFALVAVLALASAVAINTLVFFILDGLLLRPLPYQHPERLVRVYDASGRLEKWPLAIVHYEEYKRSAKTIEDIALYTGFDVELSQGERSERLTGVATTPEFFDVLGAKPFAGRFLQRSEMTRASRAVVLSHTFWQTRFQSDPTLIGKAIRINREPWTVAGIAPLAFEHIGGDYRSPLQGDTVHVWLPLPLDGNENRRRFSHFSNAVARIKPGVEPPAVREELSAITERLTKATPNGEVWRANVAPLLAEIAGKSRRSVYLLAAAGLIVMLIACANIAGLCVARALARRDELMIRSALGADRWQLARAGLAENLVLGIAGSLLGLAAAAAASPLLRVLIPADFPRLHQIAITPIAALFAVALGVGTALAAGLLPWMRSQPLAATRHTATRQAVRARTILVAAEIGLAVLLCAGGLLLTRSYQILGARDHGFQPSGVLTYAVSLPQTAYRGGEALSRVIDAIRSSIAAVPGVEAVGFSTNLPWSGWDENASWALPGDKSEDHAARFHMASPGYFESIGAPLVAGRFFDQRDTAKAPLTIIVNQALADQHLGGKAGIGKIMKVWGKDREVVGIAGNLRDTPDAVAAEPGYWFPSGQVPFAQLAAAVKTTGDPAALASAIRQAIAQVDPELPIAKVTTLEAHAGQAMAARRFALWLFQAFTVLAMALAAIGIYGLLAYTVQQRSKEFGIRIALGATAANVQRTIVIHGLRIAAAGAALGALATPLAARLIASFLFGVQPANLPVLLAAPALLLAIALLATLAPAWRASRAQPASALQHD